jgi:hypothetical protein
MHQDKMLFRGWLSSYTFKSLPDNGIVISHICLKSIWRSLSKIFLSNHIHNNFAFYNMLVLCEWQVLCWNTTVLNTIYGLKLFCTPYTKWCIRLLKCIARHNSILIIKNWCIFSYVRSLLPWSPNSPLQTDAL